MKRDREREREIKREIERQRQRGGETEGERERDDFSTYDIDGSNDIYQVYNNCDSNAMIFLIMA